MAHLIEAANIPTPLVIVGHSLGGLNALSFAALYHELVAGVVLVDSAHPDQYTRLPNTVLITQEQGIRRYWRYAALLSIGEDVDVAEDSAPWLDEASQRTIMRDVARPATYATIASELEAMRTVQSFFDRNLPRPLNVPLVVLTARNSFDWWLDAEEDKSLIHESQRVWESLQTELLRYADRSTHLHSDGHHALQVSDPESIVGAVSLILNQLKESQHSHEKR